MHPWSSPSHPWQRLILPTFATLLVDHVFKTPPIKRVCKLQATRRTLHEIYIPRDSLWKLYMLLFRTVGIEADNACDGHVAYQLRKSSTPNLVWQLLERLRRKERDILSWCRKWTFLGHWVLTAKGHWLPKTVSLIFRNEKAIYASAGYSKVSHLLRAV
jgi:hypothetical protein